MPLFLLVLWNTGRVVEAIARQHQQQVEEQRLAAALDAWTVSMLLDHATGSRSSVAGSVESGAAEGFAEGEIEWRFSTGTPTLVQGIFTQAGEERLHWNTALP